MLLINVINGISYKKQFWYVSNWNSPRYSNW
jgi:hypothetical protein